MRGAAGAWPVCVSELRGKFILLQHWLPVGAGQLWAEASIAHLVNAMLFMTGRCLALNLPLTGRQALQDHSTVNVSFTIRFRAMILAVHNARGQLDFPDQPPVHLEPPGYYIPLWGNKANSK